MAILLLERVLLFARVPNYENTIVRTCFVNRASKLAMEMQVLERVLLFASAPNYENADIRTCIAICMSPNTLKSKR